MRSSTRKRGERSISRGSESRSEWNGKRVVPSTWVDESTQVDTITGPAVFYEYFWWVDVTRP
jgi:hypothetical protein